MVGWEVHLPVMVGTVPLVSFRGLIPPPSLLLEVAPGDIPMKSNARRRGGLAVCDVP